MSLMHVTLKVGVNNVFLKIYLCDPTSKFQELEVGCDRTFLKSKIKICKTDFSQTKEMGNFAYFKNSSKSVTQIFLKFWH